MRQLILFPALLFSLFCSSCADKNSSPAADRPHAMVVMRDGTRLAGSVVESSPSEITLAGDDSVRRTIPMKQVKSIEYDDASQTAAAPGQKAPAHKSARSQAQTVHENHYHPAESVIQTRTYQLPVGTEVSVRTEETIDSSKAAEGQVYAAEVTQDVLDATSAVVIPSGSNAKIIIKSASKGGRFRGASDLVLDLRSVSVEGQEYLLDTADLQQRGKAGVGANRRTAEYTGGGAAIGAIIGAIAGGGKGAAIGAGAGAGAGALTQVLTKGSAIRVPAETILMFKLDRALRVVKAQ